MAVSQGIDLVGVLAEDAHLPGFLRSRSEGTPQTRRISRANGQVVTLAISRYIQVGRNGRNRACGAWFRHRIRDSRSRRRMRAQRPSRRRGKSWSSGRSRARLGRWARKDSSRSLLPMRASKATDETVALGRTDKPLTSPAREAAASKVENGAASAAAGDWTAGPPGPLAAAQ